MPRAKGEENTIPGPSGYEPLSGSERPQLPGSTLVGPVGKSERVAVTLLLWGAPGRPSPSPISSPGLSGDRRAAARLGADGHVASSRAEALTGAPPPPGRLPRFPQVGATRHNAAPMAAPAKTGPGPSSGRGILLPSKTIATYQKDGAKRGGLYT